MVRMSDNVVWANWSTHNRSSCLQSRGDLRWLLPIGALPQVRIALFRQSNIVSLLNLMSPKTQENRMNVCIIVKVLGSQTNLSIQWNFVLLAGRG
jgi:hypothetical protein